MTILKHVERPGVDVHLDPDECDLFVRLSIDVEKALEETRQGAAANDPDGSNYFTLSVALGRRIRALREAPPSR